MAKGSIARCAAALSAAPFLLGLLADTARSQARVGAPVSSPTAVAPSVPTGVLPAEQSALRRAALLLSKREFPAAALVMKGLMPPPVAGVYTDWQPVRSQDRQPYAQSLRQAMASWNQALGGMVRFNTAATPDTASVVVLFERNITSTRSGIPRSVCVDLELEQLEQPAARSGPAQKGKPAAPAVATPARRARAYIALNVPYTTTQHSPASMGKLFCQALGMYLGLDSSQRIQGVMGPETHGPKETTAPDADEAKLAIQLQSVRKSLADLAARQVAAVMPTPVFTVDRTSLDVGKVDRGTPARFVFIVKNTGNAALELDTRATCGCTSTLSAKSVPPGGEGRIEADIATSSYSGRIDKQLEVVTNDPDKGLVRLDLIATVVSGVEVLPTDRPVIRAASAGPTRHELLVRFRARTPVTVRSVTSSVAHVTAEAGAPNAGRTLSADQTPTQDLRLTLTVSPDAPWGRTNFVVTLVSNQDAQPIVTVNGVCEKGIVAMPPTLYLGTITSATVLPLTQSLLLSKPAAFKVLKATCEDPKVDVRVDALKSGQEVRLLCSYRGGWTEGTVKRTILVETDDPAQSRIEIPITATVLGQAPKK